MITEGPRGAEPILAWPALVDCAGGTELAVVRSQEEWELDPGLHARPYRPEDRLIDSAGVEHRLVSRGAAGRGRHAIEPTGRRIDPGEVLSLVERHLERAGARPEWLAAYLAEIAEAHKIRAAILYLSKLEGPDASEEEQDGEGG